MKHDPKNYDICRMGYTPDDPNSLVTRIRQVEGLRDQISNLVSERELWTALAASDTNSNTRKLVVAELKRRGYSDPWKLV